MGTLATEFRREGTQQSLPFLALLVSALLGATVVHVARPDANWLAGATVAAASVLMAAAVFWDLRERRIPNEWTYGGVAFGIVLAATAGAWPLTLALTGALVGGGLLAILAIASRGGLGVGDVKLGAALGTLVGPAGALEVVVVAGVAGGVLGLAWLAMGRGRKAAVPYAPALALGGWAALLMAGPVVG